MLQCLKRLWRNAKQVPLGHAGSGQGSGRAVGGQPGSNLVGALEPSESDPSGQRLGARFSVGARHNLATRVMSNGVQVIVAGKCMRRGATRRLGEVRAGQQAGASGL